MVTTKVVSSVTNTDGTSFGMRLVARSRTTQNPTEISASTANWLKPSAPGLTTISTPMKPAAMASQRRQPTGSPKISAAPSVIASDSDWKIADTLASGRWVIAARNVAVPPISPSTRSATGSLNNTLTGRNAF